MQDKYPVDPAVGFDQLPQSQASYEPYDDGDLDEFINEAPIDSEIAAQTNKVDRIAELYVNGYLIPENEDWDGITGGDMKTWYDGLDSSVREEMESYRTHSTHKAELAAQVASEIGSSAPELLRGRLPADLEQLVGKEYELGINQSGPRSPEEAQALLEEHNGIDMAMYSTNVDQRFVVVDGSAPEVAADAVTYGYYGHREAGPDLGKFVAVMPGTDYHEGLPADFFTSNSNQGDDIYRGNLSVSAKYIAGFIDEHGTFYRNANFMQLSIPALANPKHQDWV
jgi:hypothetical protein